MVAVRQRAGSVSLLGPRQVNEDSYDLREERDASDDVGALLAVADGMGGLSGGDVASRTAVKAVSLLDVATCTPEGMVNAFRAADTHIRSLASEAGDGRLMGTTLTAAVVSGQEATVAHIGDSRAYVIHQGTIAQITEDHSKVGRLLREGVISEQEAMHHPEQNVLERALGAGESGTDVYRVGIGPDDVIFLCTDGLHTVVTADEICNEIAGNPSVQAACERLAQLAEARGSQDNITAVAWAYPGGAGTTAARGPATMLHRPSQAPSAAAWDEPPMASAGAGRFDEAWNRPNLAPFVVLLVSLFILGFGLGILIEAAI